MAIYVSYWERYVIKGWHFPQLIELYMLNNLPIMYKLYNWFHLSLIQKTEVNFACKCLYSLFNN